MNVLRYVLLRVLNSVFTSMHRIGRLSPGTWRYLVTHYKPWYENVGRLHAWVTCSMAARSVPAYRRFLADEGFHHSNFNLERYPETSKDSYVRRFDTLDRCRGGKIRYAGTAVDESAGSSGKPYNWLRSKEELSQAHINFASYVSLVFPASRPFIINAYSMGAWATGTNTGIAMSKIGIVKNTGPDLEKIIDTLEYFGPRFDYIITAYPPFLKHLADELDARGFDWERFRISGQVGGEPMTEALRDYLERRYLKVRSGYGASDLTIGMGGETRFTVWLRKRIMSDRKLRTALLGPNEERTPMIFQYNPLETYLELNDQNELICTVNNSAILSPKLRYNVGDEGALMKWNELHEILDSDPEWKAGAAEACLTELMKLPLLFLYGRKDSTISYMGANIYPQDVENGLYSGNPHAPIIERFCLTMETLADGVEQRPVVNIELREGSEKDLTASDREELREACRSGVIRHLTEASRDFAESIKEDPTAGDLRVLVHDHGQGPFAGQDAKIKNKYFIEAAAPEPETEPEPVA